MLTKLPALSEGLPTPPPEDPESEPELQISDSEPEDNYQVDQNTAEQSEGGEDDSNVLVLCPSVVPAECCSCGGVVELTVVSTADARSILESLIDTTRLNLLCSPCTEELRLIQSTS